MFVLHSRPTGEGQQANDFVQRALPRPSRMTMVFGVSAFTGRK